MSGTATPALRVLFTLLPAIGSLHPLLPLARHLQARGHQVLMLSSASFGPDIARHDLASAPAGLDFRFCDRDYFARLLAASGLEFPDLTGPRRFAWVVENLFIRTAARRMLPDVIDTARAWNADLVVRESLEFSGCLAAERLGIRHASVAAAADSALDARAALAGSLAPLRADVGLDPAGSAAMVYRHLHLCFTPPCFDRPNARYPATARFFRHTNALPPGPPPDWFTALPRQPTVVVSLGTVFYRTPGVYEAILDALRDQPVNLLIAAGGDEDPIHFGNQPANVHIEPQLPLSTLLPHTDLFITHGGFNSVKEALTAGTPMLVIPLGGDQHYAAARCQALGVAATIAPDNRTSTAIRAAALQVLNQPGYRHRAASLQARMRSLPDLTEAVDQLELHARPSRHPGK